MVDGSVKGYSTELLAWNLKEMFTKYNNLLNCFSNISLSLYLSYNFLSRVNNYSHYYTKVWKMLIYCLFHFCCDVIQLSLFYQQCPCLYLLVQMSVITPSVLSVLIVCFIGACWDDQHSWGLSSLYAMLCVDMVCVTHVGAATISTPLLSLNTICVTVPAPPTPVVYLADKWTPEQAIQCCNIAQLIWGKKCIEGMQ